MENGNNSEIRTFNINSIRERIDPDKTLPEIKLEVSEDNMPNIGSLTQTKYDLKNGNNLIGEMSINTDKKNHISWIYPINIKDEYQGKGFGLVAHVVAIEKSLSEGNSFKTHDWSHTEGSKNIWEILVNKGVAKTIEPFQPDGNGKYIGSCEITPELLK